MCAYTGPISPQGGKLLWPGKPKCVGCVEAGGIQYFAVDRDKTDESSTQICLPQSQCENYTYPQPTISDAKMVGGLGVCQTCPDHCS